MSAAAPLIIVAALLGLIPASIAHSKGYSFLGWWIFGALLWIVATPVAIFMGPNEKTMRLCPFCRSRMPIEATVCASCSREVGSGVGKMDVACPQCRLHSEIPADAQEWTCGNCGGSFSRRKAKA
ncbi:MAG TPA: hypothetical protein VIJ96_01640 [Acidothermaceae bacterium]